MPINIRIGWQCLPGTNHIIKTYYRNSYITAVKSLITSAPGLGVEGDVRRDAHDGDGDRFSEKFVPAPAATCFKKSEGLAAAHYEAGTILPDFNVFLKY